jgi:transposase
MRTIETKLRIVQETLKPGVSVAEVARRHGVNANLLFSWRRQHAQGVLEHTRPPRSTKLLPVKVSTPAAEVTSVGTIEIALPCGARVRVSGEVSAEWLATVLSALGRR